MCVQIEVTLISRAANLRLQSIPSNRLSIPEKNRFVFDASNFFFVVVDNFAF